MLPDAPVFSRWTSLAVKRPKAPGAFSPKKSQSPDHFLGSPLRPHSVSPGCSGLAVLPDVSNTGENVRLFSPRGRPLS